MSENGAKVPLSDGEASPARRCASLDAVRRVPAQDQGQVPAPGGGRPLARALCAVRRVRGRAQELLLSAGAQTLLQERLCQVGRRNENIDEKLKLNSSKVYFKV